MGKSHSAEVILTNQDLLNVILSKIPMKRRLRCKAVCKSWYNVITGHVFVYKLRPPSHLLIRRYHRRTGSLLYPSIKYLTVPLDSVTPKPSLDFLESNRHEIGIRISQSCNGLLLCPTDFAYTSNGDVKYYVYNPTTNESRLIPPPYLDNETDIPVTVTTMNMAFDPSISPHYKVVSLSVAKRIYFSYPRVDIYSSETGNWNTSAAEIPRDCDRLDFSNGVFLNGAIHWASYSGETSYYFDVENECFKIMPMPDGGETRTIRFFGEAGGRLFLVHFHEASRMEFNLFMLEHDYSRWSVKHRVYLHQRGISVANFHFMSVICGDNEDDLSVVIYVPGRASERKGFLVCNLRNTNRWSSLKRVHLPVSSWDLRLLEDNGFYVVHPIFRTIFAV